MAYSIPDEQLKPILEDKVNKVLNADLYWFPVRHHSPTVARLLQQVIKQRQPKIIFIEAPSDCNHLIPHVVHRDSKPPIALYSSYRDDDNVLQQNGVSSPTEDIPARFSAWYPMLDYSPEYVALKTAQHINAQSYFIDLPHYALLNKMKQTKTTGQESQTSPKNDDPLLTQSDFYRALATSAGYQSWDEAWDSLFEFGAYADDAERFRRELATFCAASKLTTAESIMQHDGTYEREAYMRQQIQQQLTAHNLTEKEAMVVCGGFHLFMDEQRNTIPDIPKGTIYQSLVPYSFFRLSELSGYRAGNRAPYYYQKYWLAHNKKQSQAWMTEYIVEVIKKARRKGETLSTADAIAVSQHSQMLAQLRQRQQPILEDIIDATMACCCKGNPDTDGLPLYEAIDQVNIGRKIGKVTAQVGQLPIVKDYFYCLQQLDLQHLYDEEKHITLKLDLQGTQGQQRSAFFHRLAFLKITGFTRITQKSAISASLFKEDWSIKWSPEIESKLVEENLYGDTVESAVMAHIQESVAKHRQQANTCCAMLYNAIKLDLPSLMQELEEKTTYAISHDLRLISLAEAMTSLLKIEKVNHLRHLKTDVVQGLIRQTYQRGCFAISDMISAPEEQQERVIEALKILAERVFNDKTLDMELLISQIQAAAHETDIPYLKGALQGLLAELKVIPAEEVLSKLEAYSRAPQAILVRSGEFLEGLLSVSRSAIITGSPQLIEAIESLFKHSEHDVFLLMLPKIKSAFEKMDQRSKNAIADKVAQKHGLKASTELFTLNISLEAAGLMAKLDHDVNRIMQEWEF